MMNKRLYINISILVIVILLVSGIYYFDIYDNAIQIAIKSAVRANINKADENRKKGNFDKAVYYYNNALALDSENKEAFKHRNAARNEKRIYNYTKAINLDPTNAVNYYERGFVYINRHNYDKAIHDFTKAIELGGSSFLFTPQIYLIRADIFLFNKKDYDKAISDYTKAYELDPGITLFSLEGMGRAYGAKGNYDKAINYYRRAIELNKKRDPKIPKHSYFGARLDEELASIIKLKNNRK